MKHLGHGTGSGQQGRLTPIRRVYRRWVITEALLGITALAAILVAIAFYVLNLDQHHSAPSVPATPLTPPEAADAPIWEVDIGNKTSHQIADLILGGYDREDWCVEFYDVEHDTDYLPYVLDHAIPPDGQIPSEVVVLAQNVSGLDIREFQRRVIQENRIVLISLGAGDYVALVLDLRYVFDTNRDEIRWLIGDIAPVTPC